MNKDEQKLNIFLNNKDCFLKCLKKLTTNHKNLIDDKCNNILQGIINKSISIDSKEPFKLPPKTFIVDKSFNDNLNEEEALMCELILDNNIIYNFCIHNITPRAFKFNDNNDAYENASTFLEEKHKFFLFQLWLFFLVFKNDNVKLFDK